MELAGAKPPAGLKTDGLSLVSFLKGGPAPKREYFYFELHEGRPQQAIRFGDWKAVIAGPRKPMELYDLANDPGETKDLAPGRPDLVSKARALMESARMDDPNWPLNPPLKGAKKALGKRP